MGFLSILKTLQKKPEWAARCSLAYKDKKGNRYYQYNDMLDMCVHRKGEIDKCLMELRFGNKEDVLDALKLTLSAHKKGVIKPDLVTMGYLVNEITDRENMLIIPDILFKLCANTLIRHDENPYIVDEEILIEKISTFKAEIKRGGLHGFFQSVGLLRLIGLSNISTTDFQQSMNKADQARDQQKNLLHTLDKQLRNGSWIDQNISLSNPMI